jgi:hypothetical protein
MRRAEKGQVGPRIRSRRPVLAVQRGLLRAAPQHDRRRVGLLQVLAAEEGSEGITG